MSEKKNYPNEKNEHGCYCGCGTTNGNNWVCSDCGEVTPLPNCKDLDGHFGCENYPECEHGEGGGFVHTAPPHDDNDYSDCGYYAIQI